MMVVSFVVGRVVGVVMWHCHIVVVVVGVHSGGWWWLNIAGGGGC